MLIAHLAGATSRIRVGSGGVMLPNHQPQVIAEQFETDEEARRLALPSTLQFPRLRLGTAGLVPTPKSSRPRARTRSGLHRGPEVIGSLATAREGVRELVERTGVDELMATTNTHDGADRIRSYELLNRAFAPTAVV